MPNINLTVNASQRRKSQTLNQGQRRVAFPLKKAKQSQSERLQTYTTFSPPTAAPPTSSKETSHSSKLKVNSALALSVTFLMLLSNFRTANAVENGTSVENNALKDLHPLIHQNLRNQTLSVCSSIKLNNYQVLTAGHCEYIKIPYQGYILRTKAELCIETRMGNCIPVESMTKHHRLDMAILTTETPFSFSYDTCPPKLMGHKAYKHSRSHSASKNPCGRQAPHIILARGAKNDTISGAKDHSLSFGEFGAHQKDSSVTNWRKLQLESTRGIEVEGTRAVATHGDSGGPVYTCNPNNRRYELSGLVKGGKLNSDVCFITKTATRSTLNWIRKNSSPCEEKMLNIREELFGKNQ